MRIGYWWNDIEGEKEVLGEERVIVPLHFFNQKLHKVGPEIVSWLPR
jgi:hypothetical protein